MVTYWICKTLCFLTKTEINFITQDYTMYMYTQELSMHRFSIVQCKLVCFSGEKFVNPVMSRLSEWHL